MDNRRSVERIADVIRGCDPDVVCLQEVHARLPQSRLEDQPRLLSERLGMTGYFLPSYRMGLGGFGNMILTNLPMRAHRKHILPNNRERRSLIFLLERRSVIAAEVEPESGAMCVMTAHFSLNRFDRMKSARMVKELMDAAALPAVFCGDLNARPESEEMRYLTEEVGLRDAGRELGAPTFRSDRPTARIDYVWHSPALTCTKLEVVDSLASDHLPLLAEFRAMGEKQEARV